MIIELFLTGVVFLIFALVLWVEQNLRSLNCKCEEKYFVLTATVNSPTNKKLLRGYCKNCGKNYDMLYEDKRNEY